MKITYIHHSAFLIELKSVYLLFDYTEGLIPELEAEKPLFVFASHRHGDHYSSDIFGLSKTHSQTRYILSYDIRRKHLPESVLEYTDSMRYGEHAVYCIHENQIEKVEGDLPEDSNALVTAEITTYKSTDEGVAFLISVEGLVIYHGGDLNNWTWNGESKAWNDGMAEKYSVQIDKMAEIHVNVAFLPLDPRQEEHFYRGMDEFLTKVCVDTVVPMHCWDDFSVIKKIKSMACSERYRDKIVEIHHDGEELIIE